MLEIKGLSAKIDGKTLLQDISFKINPGEVHALMGPNGAGKSTLSHILAGQPGYDLSGQVIYNNEDLLSMPIHERALKGIFLAFQHPIAIPGLANSLFIKSALNAKRHFHQEQEMDALDVLNDLKLALKQLHLPEELLHRAVNEGFSGGEKKRNEILQMLLLKPKLSILDETDSGLDVDTLKCITEAIQHLKDETRSFLIITHYPNLLHYLQPDKVHILIEGKLVCTGGIEYVDKVEKEGFAGFK